jgi:membrane protease YdiL (CAAX protease family)
MKLSLFIPKVKQVGVAAVAGFGLAAVGSFFWGGLLITNLKTGSRIPWSVPAMAVVLALIWLWAGGRGWPGGTGSSRRDLLRARRVPARIFLWSLIAGALALVALAGLWIVLVDLTGVGGNPTLPDASLYPAILVFLTIVMGSLVSPMMEEAAFRGYSQVLLERRFSPAAAVAISSMFFALWHGPTQGFFWSKLFFFFVVGLVFGTIAYLSDSTLPAIPVHIAGDLLFFLVIWPQDAGRALVWTHGAGLLFWLHAGQAVVFAVLAILTLRQLARVRSSSGSKVGRPSKRASAHPAERDTTMTKRV